MKLFKLAAKAGAYIHRVPIFVGCFILHIKIQEQALCATTIPGCYKSRISFQCDLFYCRRYKYTLKRPFLVHEVLAFPLSRD